MEKLLKAVNFAAQKHSNQRRKNQAADPYINHPIEVAYFLSQVPGIDESTIIAGLLHDTVEDTNTTKDELEVEFGTEIANIVMECTDNKSLPKVTRKQLQIEHTGSPFMSRSAKLVKLADKASNLSNLQIDPPITWEPEVIRGYVMWNFAVVTELLKSNEIDADSLVEHLYIIFGSFGIHSLDQTVLKNYYHTIQKSE